MAPVIVSRQKFGSPSLYSLYELYSRLRPGDCDFFKMMPDEFAGEDPLNKFQSALVPKSPISSQIAFSGPANPHDFPLVDDENHAQSVGQFQKSIKLTLQVFLFSSLKNIRVLIVLKNNINENKSYQHM